MKLLVFDQDYPFSRFSGDTKDETDSEFFTGFGGSCRFGNSHHPRFGTAGLLPAALRSTAVRHVRLRSKDDHGANRGHGKPAGAGN
jgi:hypothetical protein